MDKKYNGLMRKAEEAEKKLYSGMSKMQRDLLGNSDKIMSDMLGVSNFSEFMKLSPREQKKRSKEANRQMLSMLGMTEEEAIEADREMREAAVQNLAPKSIRDVPGSIVDALTPLIKNVIYIDADLEQKNIKTGQSKIGGLPDVPEGFIWFRNMNGEPLSFLMQINFAEIHGLDSKNIFPENGIMYIFYDIENQPWDIGDYGGKGFKVYYCDDDVSELSPARFPEEYDTEDCCFCGFADTNCVLDERAVKFFRETDLPAYEDYISLPDVPQISPEEYENAKLSVLGYDFFEYSENYFKLGGYSDVIQHGLSDIFGEDYIQLCQLSTFDSGKRGFMFGDGGNLYFYISQSNLAKKHFGSVKINLQCY